jgi:hypothetical protein
MRYDHIGSACAAQVEAKVLPIVGILLAIGSPTYAQAQGNTPVSRTQSCQNDTSGITLPPGFCATVFADKIGHARHLVVAPNGVVYVNTWSGRYYGNDKPPAGGAWLPCRTPRAMGAPTMSFALAQARQTAAPASSTMIGPPDLSLSRAVKKLGRSGDPA